MRRGSADLGIGKIRDRVSGRIGGEAAIAEPLA
jgi:hypothetical protein